MPKENKMDVRLNDVIRDLPAERGRYFRADLKRGKKHADLIRPNYLFTPDLSKKARSPFKLAVVRRLWTVDSLWTVDCGL